MGKNTIGIDLGTTFSVVAVCDEEGKARVLLNPDGKTTTPSVIYFPGPGVAPLVGEEAKAMLGVGELDGVGFFKRHMGDPEYRFEAHGKSYSAVDLSAILLRYLKESAENELGEPVTDAVITVPAYFADLERSNTVKAAKNAGLNALKIINEPTAAAIAFGMKNSDEQKTLMVYDLGGGTFDVSVVRISSDGIQVLATAGDHRLGGKDWDEMLFSYCANKFASATGDEVRGDAEIENELMVRCEKLKCELSQRKTSSLRMNYYGNSEMVLISREEFEELTQGYLNRTAELCDQVLAEPELAIRWEDLDGVLLVGGSTRMPMVETLLAGRYGKSPMKNINPDEAVAIGAAIQARMMIAARPIKGFLGGETTTKVTGLMAWKIRDVTGHSLGMIAENADRSAYINQILIPRNTEIPQERSDEVKLRVPEKGGETEVYMLQGEDREPWLCNVLGKYVFSGIQREKKGNPEVLVRISYRYNSNGIVEVEAEQPALKNQLLLTKEPVPDDMSWVRGKPMDLVVEAEVQKIAVVLAIDGSGSMIGARLKEAEKAARALVKTLDLNQCSVGIIGFGDNNEKLLDLTQDSKKIENVISNFPSLRLHGTVAIPLTPALEMVKNFEGLKFVVLLTDGEWCHPDKAIRKAQKCREEGMEIIAIGIGDADKAFLAQLATCDQGAMKVNLSELTESFSRIGQVLSSGMGMMGMK